MSGIRTVEMSLDETHSGDWPTVGSSVHLWACVDTQGGAGLPGRARGIPGHSEGPHRGSVGTHTYKVYRIMLYCGTIWKLYLQAARN